MCFTGENVENLSIKSKELAFFNMLGESIVPNIKNGKCDVSISYSELQSKMEIDKSVISSFLEKLKDDHFINIINESEAKVLIHFEKSYEKLLNFVHPENLESILIEINDFILKYLYLFNFETTSILIKNIAKEMYDLLKINPSHDLSDLIREGLKKQHTHPLISFYYSKFFFKLAEEIEDKDQKTLENIIYYFYTLPYEENPFITTIFLSKICFQIEALKKGVEWSNISIINPDNLRGEKC